jgi:hypothetical protein
MPTGPRGEKRPADSVGCAVMVGRMPISISSSVAPPAERPSRLGRGGRATAASPRNKESFLMHGSFGKNIADKPALYSARDYEGLRRLVDACRIELRMKMLDLDVDAGLQSGYFAKLACGMKNFGPATLGPILDALDVEIVLQPRSAGCETKPLENVLQFANITRLRNYASLGGRMRRAKMTDAEWSKHCRRAGKARAQKARKNAKLVAQLGKITDSKPRAPAE